MPATSSTPSAELAQFRADVWKILRTAAVATLFFQVAGSVELVLSGTAADRLGNALFSLGWLTLVGIVTYGVTLRARWALWLAGGYAVLSVPAFILTHLIPRLFTVQVGGLTIKGLTVASTVIDLLSTLASLTFLYGLIRLRKATRN